MKIFNTLCCMLLVTGMVSAQFVEQKLKGWQYSIPINITSTFTINLTQRAVKVKINTTFPISELKMNSDGSDIRFTDSCGTRIYPHWIRSGMNTTNTEIWVLIDEINALSGKTIYMVYGSPSAASTSDFNQVFLNPYISNGSDTLSGVVSYDYFELCAGDTIYLRPHTMLMLNGRNAQIDGVIYGNGLGESGGTAGVSGSGTGGGGGSSTDGAGGGGHGGAGGHGGTNDGSGYGAGGTTYGDATSPSINYGSGGGGGDYRGGNGGGGVFIVYDNLVVSGQILMNGSSTVHTLLGGGGGSGGGILLGGIDVVSSGFLTANGGNSPWGYIGCEIDGGGGGGGRIKILYGDTCSVSGSISVTGGNGGYYGSPAGGSGGTYHLGTYNYQRAVVTSIDSERVFDAGIPISVFADTVICEGSNAILAIESSFLNYDFYFNSNLEQSGTDTSYIFANPIQDDEIWVEATNVCGIYTFVYSMDVDTLPVPVVVQSGNVLFVNSTFNSYQWYLDGNPISGETNQSIAVSNPGLYSVEVTDANGCSGFSDSVLITVGLSPHLFSGVHVYPNPATDLLVIDFASSSNNINSVEITDLSGRKMWSLDINCLSDTHSFTIPVDFLLPGIYLIRLTGDETFCKTFTKE